MTTTRELTEILASIDELSRRGRITRNRAFSAWFAINFFNYDEDEALEAAASDGGNDQGIDLVFADTTAEEIVVIQAHCPELFDKRTPKTKWDAVLGAIPYIKDPSRLAKIGRPDLAETLSRLRNDFPDYSIAVGLITLGLESNEISDSVSAHQDVKSENNVTFFYFHQQVIVDRFRVLVSSEAGIPAGEIKFSGKYIEDVGDYGRALVGSVNATELQRLHKAHSNDLFAGNIRLFLGARKGGINEQIIKTAKEEPGKFWALNNGITIVADTVDAVDEIDGSTTVKLTRFSIVNGCQTTSSIVQSKASDKAKVLARIIAAKATIRGDIVRYNNSQNAVRIWSVRAADALQQTLRTEFKAVGIDYAPKQEGSRKKKDQLIIELDKATQYLASSETEFLIQAIANKGELFDQPYQKLFYKGIQAQHVYLSWLVGSIAEDERQNLLNQISDDSNSGLLSVTSSYWIIYCTYKLFEKFTNINSPQITLERMKSKDFQNALRKYVTQATNLFYEAAVDTYERDEYGSVKSTLRSSKFLSKIDSKLKLRIARLKPKLLPDLIAVCKSIKTS
jgi:hypothetical protein